MGVNRFFIYINMLNKSSILSIAVKIMVAPAIISILLLFFGLYSYWNMSVTQTQIEDLNQATQAERSAQELQSVVHQTQAAVYRSFSLIALKQADRAKELMTVRLQAFDELVRMFDADEELKKTIQIEPVKTYLANVTDAFDAALSDPNLGAMMMQSADDSYDQTITMLQGVTSVSRIKPTMPMTSLSTTWSS